MLDRTLQVQQGEDLSRHLAAQLRVRESCECLKQCSVTGIHCQETLRNFRSEFSPSFRRQGNNQVQ